MPLTKDKPRVLTFDIENMPVTYYAPDYPTAFVTAIAFGFSPKDIKAYVIEDIRDDEAYKDMLESFWEAYDDADLVTGHYIRKHDLPIVNGALIEQGFSDGLSEKMTSDTKIDLRRFSDIPKNQEFLVALFQTQQQKYHMSQYDWREANRFKPEGIEKTRKRVTSDVRGHMQMRRELIGRGLLRAPRLWRP